MTACTHREDEERSNVRRLLLALAVIVVFMLVEIVGGVLSGSLALLADAAHMFTDGFALALAASAQIFARRPADAAMHFGYRRAQVLAAFVNGVLMAGLLCWIVIEALRRFASPAPVDASLMLWVAVAGFLANGAAFAILHQGDEQNLNMRGALLHVVGDLLGSAAAIVAALVIAATGWTRIDPLLSILVAGLIGVSAYRLLKETGLILLEGAPDHIDPTALAAELVSASPLIRDVHHIQISQLTPDDLRLTLHACIRDPEEASKALAAVKRHLERRYGIRHSTVQIEIEGDCPDKHEHEPVARPSVASAPAKKPAALKPAENAAG